MLTPILAEISGNVAIGGAALGAAIGVGLTGLGAAQGTARNPGAFTTILTTAIIAMALSEGVLFVVLFLGSK